MKSKDVIKAELQAKFGEALNSENPEAIVAALSDFAMGVQADVLDDFRKYQQTQDGEVLARRGVRQLTSEETKFYNAWANAVKTGDFKAAFTGLPDAFPETIIDSVIDEIKKTHPLLSVINFKNTSTLTRILVNKQVSQLATWSALGSKITEELDGAIGRIDLTLCKLTAFMAISKDMLDAGPQWMDAYVRETLAEASAAGLEKAIITGTGKDQPIGMDRDVSDDASVVGGVYPQKETVAVTDLSPVSFGGLLAKLAKDRNGEARAVNHVILVVNPIDYFLKVFPATTVRATDGTYNRDVLPFPTTVIQSAAVASNRAILGIPEQYFLGVGAGGEKGKIEADDSVRFLDDERVYKTKLYANGRPMDENSFLHLDVTNLKPTNYVVDVNEVKEIKGVVKTKEQTA